MAGLFALLGSTACAPSTSSSASVDSGPPVIELGAGRTAFEAFPEEGATLEIISGPQGGWHFELTLLMAGFDPEGVLLDYSVRDESNVSVAFPAVYELARKGLVETEDGRLLRVGDRTILDVSAPSEVEGRVVEVRCVASREGRPIAEDVIAVVAVDEVDELP